MFHPLHHKHTVYTSQGAAPDSGKGTIFRAKLFFGQKPTAKNEKNIFLYFLNEKKRNSFPLAEFLAGNSIYATAHYNMLSPIRPSVRLSVLPSHG